jgi:hypothetical protein
VPADGASLMMLRSKIHGLPIKILVVPGWQIRAAGE